MDVFEKYFNMLKRSEDMFEKLKTKDCENVKISENEVMEYYKEGKELLPTEKSKEFIEIRSIHNYNVVMKKLVDYTFPEWLVCLNEKVLLKYAIPIFARVLNEYPMLCGMNCEWQVLYEITKIDQDFWDIHNEWKKHFITIVNNVVLDYNSKKIMNTISGKYLDCFEKFII